MKLRASIFALTVSLAVAALAQSGVIVPGDSLRVEGVPPIPLTLVEQARPYGEFRAASFVDWHPVRREMLVETRFGEAPQVHRIAFPGGARTQLTFSRERVYGNSYEPRRGDYFLLSQGSGGNEQYQHYRFDLGSGRATLLTDGKSLNGNPVWSWAGDRIAYTSTRRTGADTDLYVMDPLDPRSTRLLMEVKGGGWTPLAWSPDDRRLVVQERLSINESYLWLVDTATGTRTPLTARDASEKASWRSVQFSPDGKGIYLTTDQGSEFQRLAYLDLESGKPDFLAPEIRWDVSELDLSWDGKRLAFVTNENGFGKLRVMDTKSRREMRLPALPGSQYSVAWHRNGRDVAFGASSSKSPPDIYSLDIRSGRLDRWTNSEAGGVDLTAMPEPEPVQWESFDGRTISGFLHRPPSRFTGKRPVIIDIHGGPESQARPGFLGRKNYYVNELGVALLFPNIRGSAGYGKTFLKLDNGVLREGAYRDLEALLNWIPGQPGLDPERIMVTGGSYGGHMTLIAATRFNDRIRCSLDVVGISHMRTFLKNTAGYRQDLRRVEYGDERDPELVAFMERTAPLNNASKIKKPIFIVQGLNDPRVPASEAEQMIEAVRKNGTPAWYLLAKDEGHGFVKKGNADFQFYATVAFIKEHLLR